MIWHVPGDPRDKYTKRLVQFWQLVLWAQGARVKWWLVSVCLSVCLREAIILCAPLVKARRREGGRARSRQTTDC